MGTIDLILAAITLAFSLAFSAMSGVWIAWQFLIKRKGDPGAELQVELEFVGKQDGKWLVEIIALVTNRGFVRHWYQDFRVAVRYLLPNDQITDGDARINYQLCCTRTIDERIDGKRRYFANAMYIDPRLTFRHSYVTFVPSEATIVWVQCSFQFPGRRAWFAWTKQMETKNVQRLFKVPLLSDGAVPISLAAP